VVVSMKLRGGWPAKLAQINCLVFRLADLR
jgi:hypothetical protein